MLISCPKITMVQIELRETEQGFKLWENFIVLQRFQFSAANSSLESGT